MPSGGKHRAATLAQSLSRLGVLKNAGVGAFPSGPAFTALDELLELLERQKVLIIRQGEMKDLNKHVNDHGRDWVTKALAAGTHAGADAARVMCP